ncbi:MAG: hypothetical protein WCL32_14815 [Planctomycetota bacterium]
MSRSVTILGVVLMLGALGGFVGWPVWKKMTIREASAQLQARTKAAVDANLKLRPDWDAAMQDNVLSFDEAKTILEKSGQKVDPE